MSGTLILFDSLFIPHLISIFLLLNSLSFVVFLSAEFLRLILFKS